MSITHPASLFDANAQETEKVFESYTTDKEVTRLLGEFLQHCNAKGKQITPSTARMILGDLTQHSHKDMKLAAAILEQSLRYGWVSLRPLVNKDTPYAQQAPQTDRDALYNQRLELAQRVLRGVYPSQKDWCQLELAATSARNEKDRKLFEEAYWHATYRRGIVGVGEA